MCHLSEIILDSFYIEGSFVRQALQRVFQTEGVRQHERKCVFTFKQTCSSLNPKYKYEFDIQHEVVFKVIWTMSLLYIKTIKHNLTQQTGS